MALQSKKTDISNSDPSNPFYLMKVMIAGSLGKLPAGLVIILVLALAAASATGLAMKYAKVERQLHRGEIRLSTSTERIDPSLMRGIWASAHKNYIMSLSLVDDRFEWIVQDLGSPKVRYFARGDWKLVTNILVLRQRKDMGYPHNPEDRSIRYIPIPAEDIEMRVAVDNSRMVWFVPDTEYVRIKGLVNGLFNPEPQTEIPWGKR